MNASGEWREVTPEELQKLKAAKIKGITRSSRNDDLLGYMRAGRSHNHAPTVIRPPGK